MGHERVGALPRTQKWRDIVDQLGEAAGLEDDVANIAVAILENVRSQFNNIHADDGVVAAFQFLVALAKSATLGDLEGSTFSPEIDLERGPSTLFLIGELRSWVETQQASTEYGDIATRASAETISLWSAKQGMQANLFTGPSDPKHIWQQADNGAGFCEVSRLFFSKFTERYLNYFLGREASASMSSIHERDRFASQLSAHIEGVSTYAFETSRITQSFAAGWFNNHARDTIPSKEESRAFLSVAFGKMREELTREIIAHE